MGILVFCPDGCDVDVLTLRTDGSNVGLLVIRPDGLTVDIMNLRTEDSEVGCPDN